MRNRYSKPEFAKLSRNKRADIVFKLKKEIEAGPYRNFKTYDYFGDGLSWADAYFVGRDKFTLWNAIFVTVIQQIDDERSSTAFDRVYALLTEEERAENFRMNFGPRQADGCRELLFGEPMKFDKFEGRTFREEVERIEQMTEPTGRERVKFLPKYRYGYGVEICLDVPKLTPQIIEDFIDGWDEKEFVSEHEAEHTTGFIAHSNALIL